MLSKKNTLKLNKIYLILFSIFFFLYTELAYCDLSILNKNKFINQNYRNLDINSNNNKENSFKILLKPNPSNKSNSFIDISFNKIKDLYFTNFKISKVIKQFLHFHASVKFINI
jgi:hypothetical protein